MAGGQAQIMSLTAPQLRELARAATQAADLMDAADAAEGR
jgi:hypothetical protein